MRRSTAILNKLKPQSSATKRLFFIIYFLPFSMNIFEFSVFALLSSSAEIRIPGTEKEMKEVFYLSDSESISIRGLSD